jgi:hypothetical protein
MSSFPRNSFHSSAAPQPASRPSSNRDSQRHSSNRASERRSSQPRGSETGNSAVRQEAVPESVPRGSSTIRRANTTAAASSQNPFSRLVASGDFLRSENPFSRREASSSLHRSNATSSHNCSNASSAHNSSSGSTVRNVSSTAAPPVGLTRSSTPSTRNNSKTSAYDELNPSASKALVPVQRSQTVAYRPSSGSYPTGNRLARTSSSAPSSRSSNALQPSSSHFSSCNRSCSHSNSECHVTMNITNFHINGNSVYGPHGRQGGGVSQFCFEGPSYIAGLSREGDRCSCSYRDRVVQLDDSDLDEDLRRADARVQRARAELRASELKHSSWK